MSPLSRPPLSRAREIFDFAFSSWDQLEQLISSLPSNQEIGDAFEYFAFFYFLYFSDVYQIANLYSDKLPERKIPADIKERLRLERRDYGVDGVIVHLDGKLTAYQSKFRTLRTMPTATELGTFWAEAEYADQRLIFANAYSLPRVAGKKQHHLEVLCDKLEKLPPEFFAEFKRFFTQGTTPKREPKHPLPHQVDGLKYIDIGFRKNDRGKLIAACGTGKTLMALWDAENSSARTVLFLAPSLILVRQTLEEWMRNRSKDFAYLCVCSDDTIASAIEGDNADLLPSELDIPVTTTASDVRDFLCQKSERRKVLFCTYQSLQVVVDAISGSQTEFDVTYFDEAHRTAGIKHNEMFAIGLNNTLLRSKRRLFMTATERLVRPWVRERLQERTGELIFSMDDASKYGPTFHRLTFGKAIQQNLICDYELIIAGVTSQPTFSALERNRYLTLHDENGVPILNSPSAAQEAAKAILLSQVFASDVAKKIITYHSTIKVAQQFTKLLRVTDFFVTQTNKAVSIQHVNGTYNSHDRAHIISVFERSKFGVLTNVRCLTEGVDLPYIDGVMFCDPKGSVVDIVQAVGRALRKPYDMPHKKAVIVVPIFIPEGITDVSHIPGEQFEAMHNVVQALRDVDESLAEWIDEANLSLVAERARIRTSRQDKIRIILPQEVSIKDFSNSIYLRIAEINRNPQTFEPAKVWGKKERSSTFERFFKTIADYNVADLESSLVLPTIKKFEGRNEAQRRSLIINNNNVSHTERLGLMVRINRDTFRLTELGRAYREKKLSFGQVFKNQILLYREEKQDQTLFPYRAALEILLQVSSLNRYEFQYGPYLIQPSADMKIEIASAIDRIQTLRSRYPRVEQTSSSNRPVVKEFLDSLHHMQFKDNDVWTDRTTVANQYRFFLNHLACLDGALTVTSSSISGTVSVLSKAAIEGILAESRPPDRRASEYYGYFYWLDKRGVSAEAPK